MVKAGTRISGFPGVFFMGGENCFQTAGELSKGLAWIGSKSRFKLSSISSVLSTFYPLASSRLISRVELEGVMVSEINQSE